MAGKFGTTVRNLISTLLLSQCSLASPFIYPVEFNDRVDAENVTFDFIIVGGGAAGSVMANRLTEIDNWNVLLIEAGADPPLSSAVPASHYSALKTAGDWNFKTEPSFLYQGLVGQVDRLAAGKMLGGSSAIGRMVYHRGRRLDYDRWAEYGVTDWSWTDNIQFFQKAEAVFELKDFKQACRLARKSYTRGTKGYMKLKEFKAFDGLPETFLKAADDIGYRSTDEGFEEGCHEGFYYAKGTLDDGERVGAARAYLSSIRIRPNLYLLKQSTATKIIINPTDHRAIGVEYIMADNIARTAYAKKEVVISAGAINTPKLLMLSGVGRETHLSAVGVPVIQDSHVGDNFQDHIVFLGLAYSVNVSVLRPAPRSKRQLDAAYEYLTRRTGEMSTIFSSIVVGYVSFSGLKEYPNVQIRFEIFEQGDFPRLKEFQEAHNINPESVQAVETTLGEHDVLIIMPILLSPKSNGTIRLRSTNPQDPPVINSGYYMADEDIEVMLLAIRFCQNFAETYHMMVLDPEQIHIKPASCFDEAYDTDLYWKCMLFELSATWNDYAGTAKMGPPTDPSAVVNNRLQVYGVGNLRVVDASVMPSIPTVNCLGPTIMIAERGADFIKKDWIEGTKKTTCPSNSKVEEAKKGTTNVDTTTDSANEALAILNLIRPDTFQETSFQSDK